MKKMFTFLWLVLFFGVSINAADMPQWKKKKLEEQGGFQQVKAKPKNNIVNDIINWAPSLSIPDYENYNFKAYGMANDSVLWVPATAASGATVPGGIYGFIFTSSSIKKFYYLDSYIGGLGGFAAFDDKIAVMGLYSGELVRTTNGGTTWDTVYSYNTPDTAFINGVVRVPGTDTVYAVGDADFNGYFVGRSVDKGATWTRLNVGGQTARPYGWYGYASYSQCVDAIPGKFWHTIYSNSAANGGVRDSLIVASTIDGGQTFQEYSIALKGNTTSYYFRSINFKDANVGFAIDRGYGTNKYNYFYKTTDGGKTWSDSLSFIPGLGHTAQQGYSVKAIPNSNWVLAVGFDARSGSKSWLSKDGGSTFSEIITPGLSNLNNFAAKDTNKIMALGYKNVLDKIQNNVDTNLVLFNVNMSHQKYLGKFDPAVDSVFVRGSFLPGTWWASNAFKLHDPDGDLIYQGAWVMPTIPIKFNYKFVQRGETFPGDRWEEGMNDRVDSVFKSSSKLNLVYFENDNTTKFFNNDVTFKVNMSIQMKKSLFNKATDSVVVRGDFNGWSSKRVVLSDADGDSVYTGTYNIKSTPWFRYKFVKITSSGDGWESSPDRVAEYLAGPTTQLPLVYFNNDHPNNVTFQVDMNIQKNLEKFDPKKDSVIVRGSFLPGEWWSNNSFRLQDANKDLIYEGVYLMPSMPIKFNYKFVQRGVTFSGDRWEEGMGDRVDSITSGPVVLKKVFFENDSTSVFFNNNVTFSVNMSVQMKKSKFSKTADSVVVRGDFNGWGGKTHLLKDADGDSIYTGVFNIKSIAKFRFKFVTLSVNGDGWESSDDRVAENLTGPTTILPKYWFNNDSVIVNIVPVVFRVNMRVKMAEGAFKPATGHKVFARGEMNGWSEADELSDPNTDSIYTKTIDMDEGKEYKYKFMMKNGNDVWEGGNDKVFKVPVGGGSVPLGYFDGDSLVSTPTSGTIMYRVNMKVYEDAGWFKRADGDSMQINGGFNSWGGSKLTRKSGTEVYELARQYQGFTYDQEDFKFFMNFNPTTVKARFPEFNEDTKWGFHYEHPAARGDGNRIYNYGAGGNIQTPVYQFSDIDGRGIIKENDSVKVNFKVDMTPALTHSVPFNPASDTVKIIFFDDLWRSTSKAPKEIKLTKFGATNNYIGSIKVKGKTHYNMMYQVNYGSVTEGGGLGVQNPYRSRFIQPTGDNKFPTEYNTPVDVFKPNSPLPGEQPPFMMGVINQVNMIPNEFAMDQNYPNPFNPSTKIRFALPSESVVKLRVYNMLGQVVATIVNERKAAGEYIVSFDASHLGSGAYFYSLEAGTFKSVKKMLLMK